MALTEEVALVFLYSFPVFFFFLNFDTVLSKSSLQAAPQFSSNSVRINLPESRKLIHHPSEILDFEIENFDRFNQFKGRTDMESEAARTAKESLDLAFHMSNILDTGLDRHTLSLLIALCDLGFNPEALAALVKELGGRTTQPSSSPPSNSSS